MPSTARRSAETRPASVDVGRSRQRSFEEWNRETGTRKLPDRAGSPEKRMPLSPNKSAVKIKVLRPRQNGTARREKALGRMRHRNRVPPGNGERDVSLGTGAQLNIGLAAVS